MKKKLFLGLTILWIVIYGNAFAYLPGDVNNDGKIDHVESISAMRVMAGMQVPLSNSSKAKSFFVEGDKDKYYAVLFYDHDWSQGPAKFEISRSNVHADGKWHGSMNLIISWHSSKYGHRSNFLNYHYKNHYNAFVADIKNYNYYPYAIVWLKGQTTYNYRSIKNNIEMRYILGTDNNTCLFDFNSPPEERSMIDCTHRTEVHPSIKTGKNITMPVNIESNVDLKGDFNMTGQFTINGNITSNEDICIGKCD